jgi:3-hydroxybutyryl-CoA dehydrogenase
MSQTSLSKIAVVGHPTLNRLVAKWWEAHDVEVICVEKDQSSEFNHIHGLCAVFDTLTGPTEKKKKLIQDLDREVGQGVPIFTSILHHTATEISSWCADTTRIIGFHPLHFDEMKVIEVAPALQSNAELVKIATQFLEKMGKKVEIIEDAVAGVLPRTLALLINEASHALAEEVATAEDIDIAMKKGTNYPLGPLEWADRIGLDQVLFILEGLQRDLGEDRYRPSPLLRKKVLAKQLGLSTSEGFYPYE